MCRSHETFNIIVDSRDWSFDAICYIIPCFFETSADCVCEKVFDLIPDKIMSKSIINQVSSNGISTITTINTPASGTDKEIVVWDGTNADSIAGGHGVLLSVDGDI